jgi:signal transduction histidine kinase/AraC-like DNA-binding protein
MPTNILVVDDEHEVADMLSQRFRHKIKEGAYQFQFATSGQQALDLAEAHPDFDVLLLDINIPDIDGLTLLGRLPTLLPHSRAVIVSAYGDLTNIRRAMNQGAFDFVCKPINYADLDATIEKTAQHVQHLREAARVKLLSDLKARFFDNIAHEFRTPLTLILAPVEALLLGGLPEAVQHDLRLVERNARHLLALINQLLELSRLEAGQVQVQAQAHQLSLHLQELVESFQPIARQHAIALNYHSSLAGQWWCDAEKIASIGYNLLANALKFMPGLEADSAALRQVTVTLAQADNVELTVTDTGLGIAADSLPRIFDRFYRAPAEAGARPVGVGLGLALVQELTTLLGGEVTVESHTVAPSGTTFRVALPLLPVGADEPLSVSGLSVGATPVAPVVTELSPLHPAEAPLLLLVEDNEELRVYLARQLAAHYRVLAAADGAMGWQLVQQELPDLVLSDVMMPGLDGYELTDLIKTTPATDHIAVVLLTAKATSHQRLTGLRRGADDYLTKPFSLEELVLRLHNLVTRQQRLRQLYTQQFAQPELAPATTTIPNAWLQSVYALLEKHLDKSDLSVEWLAEQLMMSRKTLLRKVQALLQLSPSEVIQQYRLRRATDLLRAGYSVSETAYAVGFNTPAYFGQCFKDFYHLTPSEFGLSNHSRIA